MTSLRNSPSGPALQVPGFNAEPSVASVAGAAAININEGPAQKLTLNQNTVLAITGFPPGQIAWAQLKVIQGPVGSFTLTITGAKTPGASALTLSTVTGSQDIVSLYWDGAAIYAAVTGLAFA